MANDLVQRMEDAALQEQVQLIEFTFEYRILAETARGTIQFPTKVTIFAPDAIQAREVFEKVYIPTLGLPIKGYMFREPQVFVVKDDKIVLAGVNELSELKRRGIKPN